MSIRAADANEKGLAMIRLKTITMQLINGDPNDIRICRVEGEALITLVIPRDKVADAKLLPDIPSRGIYYLLDEDHGAIRSVYAGQTVQGICRLDEHKKKKEFWNKAIMFLTDNQNMSQDVLNGLEAKAIDYIATHGSYSSCNNNLPKPYVSPYSEGSIERLHADVLFRMAALGYDLDRVSKAAPEGHVFHTKRNGVRGMGTYDEETGTFRVLAGSQVDMSRPIINNVHASELRESLFPNENGIATLAEDVELPAPSAAAVFVLGCSANGWTEWVDDNGNTLSDVYRTGE
jgi:hypothetical protein